MHTVAVDVGTGALRLYAGDDSRFHSCSAWDADKWGAPASLVGTHERK